MNKSYKLYIEILTPVHISDGNTISGIDYFCYKEKLNSPYEKMDDGKYIKNKSFLYKFNIQKFINILNLNDKTEFSKLLEMGTDTFEIRNFIYKKLEEDSKNEYKIKFINISKEKIEIKNSFYVLWKEKIKGKSKHIRGKTQEKKDNEFMNQLSQLQISSFIKSLGRVYIPGSSIKGALRTILTNKNIENTDIDKDPFKKLIVRDSEFINNGIKIGKLARQSNKGEGIYAEFLGKGTKTNTKILLKSFLNDNFLEKIDLTKENIIFSSNKFCKEKIESYIKELIGLKNINSTTLQEKIKKMKNEKIDSVIDSFNKIITELKNLTENQFILNIGFGGGYWFKSFEGNEKHPMKEGIKNLKSDDLNIPRTNNMIDLENLGFIKCTFID